LRFSVGVQHDGLPTLGLGNTDRFERWILRPGDVWVVAEIAMVAETDDHDKLDLPDRVTIRSMVPI